MADLPIIPDGSREEDLIVLLGQLPVACALFRADDHTVVAINEALEALLGWGASLYVGRHIVDLPVWTGSEQREWFHQQVLVNGRIPQYEAFLQCHDGQIKPCLAYVERICIGDEVYRLAVAHDLSGRSLVDQKLKQSEAKFAALFVDSPEPYVLFSRRSAKMIEINHRFTEVFGYKAEDVIGKTAAELNLWRYPEKRPAVIAKLMREQCLRNEPIDLVASDGGVLNCEVSSNFILIGTEHCTLSCFKDVTEKRTIEARVKHQAFHDALTDLPNRLLLHDRLQQHLAVGARHGLSCALLFFDLDHFKRVNDSLGHGFGDAVLKEVSSRLLERIRKADTVARIGGDEFVILLTGLSGKPDQIAERARVHALELLEAVSAPMMIEGHGLQLSCSIGIALSVEHGGTPDDLLKHADTALYGVKASGRNNVAFFEPHMQVIASQRLQLETELRQALQAEEFRLHYQPQVDASAQRIIGAEALVRWQHPERGLTGPAGFIDVLEESGMILEVGHWIVQHACRFIARLLDRKLIDAEQFCLSVNISPRQFRQANFVARIASGIAEENIPAQCLKLEITEGIMIHNMADTVKKMNELRDMGIGFAIDDFGTGYSSLSYLKRLPVDLLKIDQSFVRDCTYDSNDAEIVRAIIAMARSLKMELIAEGVETGDQLAFLQQQECHTYQGYYFSRPIGEEAFCELLGAPFEPDGDSTRAAG